jgi:hypothetical protein
MAQLQPEEKVTVDQVLRLVGQLTAEEQGQVFDQLKLEDLRREIRKGIEASERGEVYREEEVLAPFRQGAPAKAEKMS